MNTLFSMLMAEMWWLQERGRQGACLPPQLLPGGQANDQALFSPDVGESHGEEGSSVASMLRAVSEPSGIGETGDAAPRAAAPLASPPDPNGPSIAPPTSQVPERDNTGSLVSGGYTDGSGKKVSSASFQSNVRTVVSVAQSMGVDPKTAVATMLAESGGANAGKPGDGGTSFGLFQLHIGGELDSLPGPLSQKIQEAKDPTTNAKVALSEFARVQDATGLTGGALAAAAQRPKDRALYARTVDSLMGQAAKAIAQATPVAAAAAAPAATDAKVTDPKSPALASPDAAGGGTPAAQTDSGASPGAGGGGTPAAKTDSGASPAAGGGGGGGTPASHDDSGGSSGGGPH